ncbi:hypothetical protein PIB30_000062 [Stylosanthes scabra]|uniref:Uncharacterized protein n=1 Tax=Stylosanthes scabra TaxID=79078 RepID=A0ABU6Q206_9FABA|nr:hypothetical protein [Stylosanthes scabra]
MAGNGAETGNDLVGGDEEREGIPRPPLTPPRHRCRISSSEYSLKPHGSSSPSSIINLSAIPIASSCLRNSILLFNGSVTEPSSSPRSAPQLINGSSNTITGT